MNNTSPDTNTVIHIGFPKTGTTTLQAVLMKSPDCHYIGKGIRDTMRPSDSLDVAKAIFFADSHRFNEMESELQTRLADKASMATCLVMSDEAFSFAEHMKLVQVWKRQVVTDHRVVADRLSRLCPGARVLISVRNQLSFLKSWFHQSRKVDDLDDDFDTFINGELAALSHRSMLHLLRYDEVYDSYAACFGEAQVYVSVFEDYKSDFGSFIDHVAAVCNLNRHGLREIWNGQHHNKVKLERPAELVGVVRRTVPPRIRNLIPKNLRRSVSKSMVRPPEPSEFRPNQRHQLTEFFRESNIALMNRSGVDVAKHDYP